MDKIVVFGLGNIYEKIKDYLDNNYEIVAYIDNNSDQNALPIKKIIDLQFDYVVITSENYTKEMYVDIKEYNVPDDKIKVYYKDKIVPINDIYRFGINSYSQFYEDLIISAIFLKMGIEKPSYIDLGAHEPYFLSNTAGLYEKGGRGINIEANPELIGNFEKYRKEDINLNIGIGLEDGVLPFYIFDNKSGWNTFSLKEAKWREKTTGVSILRVIDLPVTTLPNVVNKYMEGKWPDLLDSDVEGMDYKILEACDFALDGPKVIIVESGSDNDFKQMLTEKGYYFFCLIGCNSIYIRNQYKSIIES